MPKKILFILLIILLIAPRIAMASFFDDLLSRIRNLINNTNLNNNPTNEVNNTDQTINTTFNPSGFCFVKELEFGDRNSDVSELQKLLSQFSDIYPEKLVTGYFGNLTKQAVIRFQNKFKSEVLTPAGLKYGTGYVGKYTLNKLNSLNECLDTDQNNNIIDDSNSDLEINIDAQTEDEILEPTPTPDGNSDNPIDNNPPTTDSTLPTVKIKTYCSNVSSLLINSASMDSTPEKTDIRKMIFNFENPSYEDATNIVIDINGQTVNVGDINACQDEDYRKNVKSIAFDYQCKANEREVDVIVYWSQNDEQKSFTKKIRTLCYQCKPEIPKLGVFQYTIFHKDLKPEHIKWEPYSEIFWSSGQNTPYWSGYIAKCYGYTESKYNETQVKASVWDLPDINDSAYIYNPPTASNKFWIYCPLVVPENTF